MAEYFSPDNLIAGDYPIVTKSVTIPAGTVLSRGSVLGIATATGNAVLATAGATDGSQNPDCILAEDVDATAAAVVTTAYQSGEFVDSEVVLDASIALAAAKPPLRSLNIYLKSAV